MRPPPSVLVLGVRGRHADGKAPRAVGDEHLAARRANLRLGGLPNRVRQLRRHAADHVENRLADSIGEFDAEQMLGRRIRVEQPARDVDGDDAAADVAQNVFRLEARPLERGDELVRALAALAQLRAEVANDQRDERDDAELQPDGRLGSQTPPATPADAEAPRRRRNRRRGRAPATSSPPPAGTSSDAVAMTRM